MDERRQNERKIASFYAEVRCRDTGELIGHLADISTEGMMLIGDAPAETGRELQLQIELPRSAAPRTSLEITARICWSQPDMDLDLFAIGLEFVEGTAPGREDVRRLCRTLTAPF